MKYIVINHTDMIIFQRYVSHDDMANDNGGADKVTSAGLVENVDGELSCTGYSHSLGIESKKSDTELMRSALRLL